MSSPRDMILAELRRFIPRCGESQVRAWRDSLEVLNRSSVQVLREVAPASNHSAVLEYELPREAGRRPDVLVLQNGRVVVLEFKEHGRARRAFVDQVRAYARDLQHYHSECHDLEMVPVLVLCGAGARPGEVDGVRIVPGADLPTALVDMARTGSGPPIDLDRWLQGDYAPLPTLVTAARLLFERQPLPSVRRAHSLGVPDTVRRILEIAEAAAREKRRVLVLLTGVPGAGKTLVGLQVAHTAALDEHRVVRRRGDGAPATFLSGNAPLVQVLQHALRSTTFVQDMHRYVRRYGLEDRTLPPPEHLIVFDEAQRAWDREKIGDFYTQRMGDRMVDLSLSEPDILIEIADRIPQWSVVLALVGSGQEIHTGEEAGLGQWVDAVRRSPKRDEWTVFGPTFLLQTFRQLPYQREERLNLDATLRSHAASDLHRWVNLVLDQPNPTAAGMLAGQMRDAGFPIYVTRDLTRARAYLQDRFGGEPDRRFGLLASSKAQILTKYGIDPGFMATRRLKVANWFNDDPSSALSCCQLREVATEFQVQGLELDLPLVCWGDDFYWRQGWQMRQGRRQRLLRDPFQLRVNAYRVLLTRGREGLVVFVPPEPLFDETFDFLVTAGAVAAGGRKVEAG